MNKKLLLFLVLPALLSACCGNLEKTRSVVHPDAQGVLRDNAHVHSAAVEIMQLLGCADIPTQVDKFVELLAPKFARKRDQERWEMQDNLEASVKDKVLDKFDELGFLKTVAPRERTYEYIVVFSGTLNSMRRRFAYVKQLWQAGVRAKSVVFLTGDRLLVPFEDLDSLNDRQQTLLPIKKSWQPLEKLPINETALMQELWGQADLPADLAALPCQVVDTPQRTWPDGTVHRPNTGDTLEWWMKSKPVPGRSLFISNQPYVGYQGAVARRWVPENFLIETVGPEASRDRQKVSVLVDTLFRWLAFEAFHCKLWDEKTLEAHLKQ